MYYNLFMICKCFQYRCKKKLLCEDSTNKPYAVLHNAVNFCGQCRSRSDCSNVQSDLESTLSVKEKARKKFNHCVFTTISKKKFVEFI